MRFGRTLQLSTYPPWRDNYIDYTKLKSLLKEDESAPTSPSTAEAPKDDWTDEDEGAFVDELVNKQLEKVHTFHKETYEKLRDRTASCEAKLDGVAVAEVSERDHAQHDGAADSKPDSEATAGSSGKKPVPSDGEKQKILKEVLKELDQITKETNELEKYSRINYTGFLKAAKKHDRKRGGSYRVRPLLQVRLAALAFNKEDYGPLLYRLSAMYSFVREHLEGVDIRSLSLAETPMGKDEYVSHKFWVHPENLLEVKTMILRRLPVLVYNPQSSKIAEGSRPDPSITSIYFDNPAFSLYTTKVDSGEASSVRLRWYGQLNERPQIWIEKKTITEDNTSHESRFTTKDKYVQRFIKDAYHMEKQITKIETRTGADSAEATNLKESVDEIQSFIKNNELQPVLRANYTRTAFQIPGDDRVRISLDTDLAFIREDAIDADRPCRDPADWHRTDIDDNELSFPFTSIRKGEISRFPFALLELKIRNTGKRSEWISDIMNSHLVKQAPRFSKFVHGVSVLFEDYVNTFPFWLSDMEVDIRRDPQQAFEEEQAKMKKEADDEFAVGSLLRSTGSMSPLHAAAQRSPQRKGMEPIISPIGSPNIAANIQPTPKKPSNLGQSVVVEQTQLDEVVEEPDEDETGDHAHGAERTYVPGGLKNLLPSSFSSSKYAQHKRRLPEGVSKPDFWIKDQGPVKVEAKVWLANQRTFIKWQHVSILLATLSVGLYNAAGQNNDVARALAVVYTVIAVFTGMWGYGIYMWRSSLIEKRSGKDFDAVTGPVVVCAALVVALILNFVFKYRLVLEERENGSSGLSLNQTEYLMFSGEL